MKAKQVQSRYLDYTNAFKDSSNKLDSQYDKTTRPLTIDEKDVIHEEDMPVKRHHHDRSSPQFMSYQGPKATAAPWKNNRHSEFVEFLEGLDTKYQTNSAALIHNHEIALNVKQRRSKLRNHYIDIYNTGSDMQPTKKKLHNATTSSLKNVGKATLTTIGYAHN